MELTNRLYYGFKNAPGTMVAVDCDGVELKDGDLIVKSKEPRVLNMSELQFFDMRPNKKH